MANHSQNQRAEETEDVDVFVFFRPELGASVFFLLPGPDVVFFALVIRHMKEYEI